MLTEPERRQLALSAEAIRKEIVAAERWLDCDLIRTGIVSDIFVKGMIYQLNLRLNDVLRRMETGDVKT